MTWVCIDDGFAEHPKVVGLTDRALRSLIGGLCYAARHSTDGHIPAPVVRQLATAKIRAELVTAGLWDDLETGIWIHDYLAYNPSRAQIEQRREQRRQSGRVGAEKRWRTS